MRQEDAAVGEVQPGEHVELIGLDAVKPVDNGGIELELRPRCAFERVIGSVGGGASDERTTPIGCTTYGSLSATRASLARMLRTVG
jgi:hypothetical protein